MQTILTVSSHFLNVRSQIGQSAICILINLLNIMFGKPVLHLPIQYQALTIIILLSPIQLVAPAETKRIDFNAMSVIYRMVR